MRRLVGVGVGCLDLFVFFFSSSSSFFFFLPFNIADEKALKMQVARWPCNIRMTGEVSVHLEASSGRKRRSGDRSVR